MRAPITRPSNVAGMLLAGRYRYRSSEEDPGQLVMVSYELGKPIARVMDGEDEGLELDTRTLAGIFERSNE